MTLQIFRFGQKVGSQVLALIDLELAETPLVRRPPRKKQGWRELTRELRSTV